MFSNLQCHSLGVYTVYKTNETTTQRAQAKADE